MAYMAASRNANEHYTVNIPLQDKRGDTVLIGEFDKLDLNDSDIISHSYEHPHVVCGSSVLPGTKNQDRTIIRASEDDSEDPHYFGVFDGHGLTATAADMCVEELHDLIFSIDKEMKMDKANTNSAHEDEHESFVVPTDEAIVEAFHEMDKKVRDKKQVDSRTGTCAVVLLLGKRIIPVEEGGRSVESGDSNATHDVEGIAKVAWVGDSRCIMIEEDGVYELTKDHRLDAHEGEHARILESDLPPRPGLVESSFWKKQIEEKGGEDKLKRSSFIGRRYKDGPKVLFAYSGGISLQITRSIGDAMAARSAIATPEIRTIRQEGAFKAGRFLLASDGLWDVMDAEAVAKFVRKYRDPKVAATKLCQYAKNKRTYKGLYPDDISVVVVDVNGSNHRGSGHHNRCKVM